MYCSSCGEAVQPGLTYCNHCGMRVVRSELTKRPPDIAPDSLVWAIVAIFVVGLGVTIGLLAVMRNTAGFHVGLIIFFMLLSFLLMTLIEAVFVWLLMSSRREKVVESLPMMMNPATTSLPNTEPRSLPETPASVTDHTTRNFDPVYVERKAK